MTTETQIAATLPLVREGGGSLSILDSEGRHVAELAWNYYDTKTQRIRKWTDEELSANAEMITRAVNTNTLLVEFATAIEPYLSNEQEMLNDAAMNEGRASGYDVASIKGREALAQLKIA